MSIPIRWFKKAEFDAPELKSPQPCVHGAGCIFTIKNAEGKVMPGCCHFVHPGEEGNGRRLFPARVEKGVMQPACVRLTGKAGFYERCRLKMSWQAWCERENIPYTPNKVGVRHEPVKHFPIGKLPQTAVSLRTETLSVFERISMLVKESELTEEEKCDAERDLRDHIFYTVSKIISKVERSIGVPLTAEEEKFEETSATFRAVIDKMFEPSKRTVKIVAAEPEAEQEIKVKVMVKPKIKLEPEVDAA
jgi:hypothetical protein